MQRNIEKYKQAIAELESRLAATQKRPGPPRRPDPAARGGRQATSSRRASGPWSYRHGNG